MTTTEKGLVWYGIVPAFFSTLVGIAYFIYQVFAFRSSPFFGGRIFEVQKITDWVINFAGTHTQLTIFFVGIAALVGIAYLLLPPLFEGGLIGLVAALHRGKEVKTGDGIGIGVRYFLRMFEHQMVISTFSFAEFFLIFSLGIRNFGLSAWLIFILIFFFIVSLIFGFLFIYTQNFIVLEDHKLISAFGGSAKLAVGNLGKTFLMWLLILLISLRVIINIFLIFLIPVFVAAVMNFFVSTIALWLGVALGIVVSLAALALAAYLAGILHVFTTATWTLAFLSLDYHRAEKLLEK